jgi:hypothetical protein
LSALPLSHSHQLQIGPHLYFLNVISGAENQEWV